MSQPATRAEARKQRRGERILRPRLRQWAYALAAASIPIAVLYEWIRPEAAPLVLPLLMAAFYVDTDGNPK